ncbi:MAG TPA: hypothetical protein VHN17_08455 [Steroidobacteraceae bacterium]|jgi:hypothetical protein|nr:hypothetical protein [Steroidobacteraceae bacterium]
MAQRQTRRRSQREIREGKAPRRLAERRDLLHLHQGRRWSGAAHLARRVALAVSVLLLVIASTVVYSDDYSPAIGSDVFWLSPSWRF